MAVDAMLLCARATFTGGEVDIGRYQGESKRVFQAMRVLAIPWKARFFRNRLEHASRTHKKRSGKEKKKVKALEGILNWASC
jgi:hypothetical protein